MARRCPGLTFEQRVAGWDGAPFTKRQRESRLSLVQAARPDPKRRRYGPPGPEAEAIAVPRSSWKARGQMEAVLADLRVGVHRRPRLKIGLASCA